MTTILLFSQNLILDSFVGLKEYCKGSVILLTTHHLFENEIEYLKSMIGEFEMQTFSQYLTDKEQEEVDILADNVCVEKGMAYYLQVRLIKNQKISQKIADKYPDAAKYLLSNDLGIDESPWIRIGFKKLKGRYYYDWSVDFKTQMKQALRKLPFASFLYSKLKHNGRLNPYGDDVYSAEVDGKKYVFIGRLQRVGYRIGLPLRRDDVERKLLDNRVFHDKNICQYLSSIHERGKCIVPDSPEYDVRYIQDGYLPPNYSACDLKYIPKNAAYYAWDKMGMGEFRKHNIPASIMPFRKKLYMPAPLFREKIKTILVATSGTGDWTAQKNRSDDDLMVMAFVEIARRFPDIKIIYRAHPTWVHPMHVGVNSIKRVAQYFEYTGLKNIHLSANIPDMNGLLSFSRSSLEDDLKEADIVFGEHSVSMIDAAFDKIPFASVNLTTRRDFACGLTELGFPHCKTIEDIAILLEQIGQPDFQKDYCEAVKKYNIMTDIEE